MNVKYFPFDYHNCTLELANWHLDQRMMDLYADNATVCARRFGLRFYCFPVGRLEHLSRQRRMGTVSNDLISQSRLLQLWPVPNPAVYNVHQAQAVLLRHQPGGTDSNPDSDGINRVSHAQCW
jgi:hypothetical protein